MKMTLDRKVDVSDFLRYLYEHIGLLGSLVGPLTFKSFRPPKEMPGPQKIGSFLFQKSGSRPVFSAAASMVPQKSQWNSKEERAAYKEKNLPSDESAGDEEGRRKYLCAFCNATHYLHVSSVFGSDKRAAREVLH